MYFFFQAEDGIRDRNVTGVQTCALPILRIWVKPDQLTKLGMTVTDLTNAVQQQSAVNPAGQIGAEPAPKGQQFTYAVRAAGRSEERRVGKECRSRGLAED